MVNIQNTDLESMYIPKNWQYLRDWLNTDLGKYVLEQEEQVLKTILDNNISVYNNILVIGEPNFYNNLSLLDQIDQKNKKVNKFIIHPVLTVPDQIKDNILIVARQDKLPICSDSIDLVVLPHSLEMLSNPHEILRESHRVLRPEGKIVITGFASISVWRFWKLISKIFYKAPWRNEFISSTKLVDWLALLGFNEFTIVDYCHILPVNNKYILDKLQFLEKIGKFLPFIFGNIYTIFACKRVIPLTPLIIKEWEKKSLDSSLAKPVKG